MRSACFRHPVAMPANDPRARRPAAMADVAERAGVSKQTISRVVNGTGYVAPGTRERVLTAMREVGYKPNSAARALVTGRSRSVGVIGFDTTAYAPTSILLGFERAARDEGYLVIGARRQALDASTVGEAIGVLQRHRVEGILLHTGQRELPPAVYELADDTPTVTFLDMSSSAVSTVAVDQRIGTTQATRLLADLGHRGIAHLAGPQESLLARQRLEAWRDELQRSGLRVPEPLEGDFSAQSGLTLGRQFAADPEITAILAGNDAMAIGVLRALHLAGRRVPEDVSLIGFDDLPESRFLNPPLTTVRTDFDELGRKCFQMLYRTIEGENPPTELRLTPELIVRESTGAAPR